MVGVYGCDDLATALSMPELKLGSKLGIYTCPIGVLDRSKN